MSDQVPIYDLYGERRQERPGFWVHCETIASRSSTYHWEIGLHRHDIFQQFLYIRDGSGDAIFLPKRLALSPPCIICVPPRTSHGFRFSRDIDGLVVTLLADRLPLLGGGAQQPENWLAAPRLVSLRSSDDAAYFDETLGRLHREVREQKAGSNELAESYLKTMVLLLNRLVGSEVAGPPKSAKLARVQALENLIASKFREQWSVTQYADALRLTPTHLNRLVREVRGVTVHDLVMARVLEEARRLLVFTAVSVATVAEQLGFTDAAYFIRCFRKRTGVTPGHYREAERQRIRDAAQQDIALTVRTAL